MLAIGSIEGARSIATLEHLGPHDAEPERSARTRGAPRRRPARAPRRALIAGAALIAAR